MSGGFCSTTGCYIRLQELQVSGGGMAVTVGGGSSLWSWPQAGNGPKPEETTQRNILVCTCLNCCSVCMHRMSPDGCETIVLCRQMRLWHMAHLCGAQFLPRHMCIHYPAAHMGESSSTNESTKLPGSSFTGHLIPPRLKELPQPLRGR